MEGIERVLQAKGQDDQRNDKNQYRIWGKSGQRLVSRKKSSRT